MKRKGFTLVELLAVIVILAVIALIATPMMLGVIETARKGAAESSVLGYLEAIEKQIMINELDSSATKITDGVYDLPMDIVSVKGEVPSEGWIVIENSKITNYSMKMMDYVATKGEEVTKDIEIAEKPSTEISYICKRATVLHTEECTQTSSYCYASGYVEGSEKGTTIEYGRLGTMGEELQSGDALDCDVDGTGYNHRFYYVTDIESNSEYAVLIYYNNTAVDENGKIKPDNTSNGLIAYSFNNQNWHGPTKAIANLPKVSDWNNVSLVNKDRTITNELGKTTVNSDSQQIENPFSYEEYATRLLTIQEIEKTCNIKIGSYTRGELGNCNYLMENTTYSNDDFGTGGYWLETPSASDLNRAMIAYAPEGRIATSYVYKSGYYYGVRPVIEVSKTKILH